MKISTTSERLKEFMREERLKQVDILEICKPYCEKYDIKLGKNDLSQYVNGKVEPGQAKLFILANALNVNEAWLMGYDVTKERCPIITKHNNITDELLYAIQVIAAESGYSLKIFAQQYQIYFEDFCVRISPKELEDLASSSIEQIRFVIKSIIDNKLNDNISPIKVDRSLNAASVDDTATDEARRISDNIMYDDAEWE